MAQSVVGICNSALIKLGANPIATLTDPSKSANLCNSQFEKMRDEVLRAHPWKFARKRASLAQVLPAPSWGYAYNYQLPSDYLNIAELEIPDAVYTVEGSMILTDEDTMNIGYTFRCVDPTKFDPIFCEALSLRLASDICYAITQSIPLRDELMTAYKEQLRLARSMNGQEGTAPSLISDAWSDSRK